MTIGIGKLDRAANIFRVSLETEEFPVRTPPPIVTQRCFYTSVSIPPIDLFVIIPPIDENKCSKFRENSSRGNPNLGLVRDF